MKFIIILLISLFAITVNSSEDAKHDLAYLRVPSESHKLEFASQDGIVQNLIKLIENIIKKVQETIETILSKLESILQSIYNNIQKIIDQSRELVNKTTNKALDRLEEIALQSELSRKCVENSRPKLDAAIAEYGLEIEACRENAVNQAQNIRNDIEPHIEAIRTNIDALEDIVSECLESTGTPLQLIVCVANKTEEIQAQLYELTSSAKKAITTGPKRGLEIVNEARTCIKETNNKFAQTIESIIEEILQCIENGEKEPESDLKTKLKSKLLM